MPERGDKEERAETRRAAQEPEAEYDYSEMLQAGPRFGVSNETIAGALHAAGHQRRTRLTVSQVEEALKAFARREIAD